MEDIIMRTNRRNKLTKLQIERFVSSMDEKERLFVRMKNTKNFEFKERNENMFSQSFAYIK